MADARIRHVPSKENGGSDPRVSFPSSQLCYRPVSRLAVLFDRCMISQFILLLTLVFVSLGTSLSMTSFHEIQSSIASPGVVSTFNADQLFLDFVAVGETTARNVMSEFLTEEVVGRIPADYFRRIGGRGRLLASVLQELYDKSASSAQDAKRIFEEVMSGQTTTTGNPHSLYGCWLRGAGNNPIWSFYVLILGLSTCLSSRREAGSSPEKQFLQFHVQSHAG